MFGKKKSITMQPRLDSFPFWQADFYQPARIIPGGQLMDMIADIGINRIPGQTDFNQSDIRTIPKPNVNQDVTGARELKGYDPQFGVSQPGSLFDLLAQTQSAAMNGAGNG